MNINLIYVMDPMCSWCYGFAPVFSKLVDYAQKFNVGYKITIGGLRAGNTKPIDNQMRSFILEHWKQVNLVTSQHFLMENALPIGFVYDTFPACKAVICVRVLDTRKTLDFIANIQHAFYAKGLDITKFDELLKTAKLSGINPQQFIDKFNDENIHKQTCADFIFTKNLGVTSFPTVFIENNKKYTLLSNGYQTFEQIMMQFNNWVGNFGKSY